MYNKRKANIDKLCSLLGDISLPKIAIETITDKSKFKGYSKEIGTLLDDCLREVSRSLSVEIGSIHSYYREPPIPEFGLFTSGRTMFYPHHKRSITECKELLPELLKSIRVSSRLKSAYEDHEIKEYAIDIIRKLALKPLVSNHFCCPYGKFEYRNCGIFFSIYPDLIIDDKIIEIKSDVSLRNYRNNFKQLIRYWLVYQLFYKTKIDYKLFYPYKDFIKSDYRESPFNLPKINRLGIFYIRHNKYFEYEINELIPNANQIFNCYKKEIDYRNHYLDDLIYHAIDPKSDNSPYLNNLNRLIDKKLHDGICAGIDEYTKKFDSKGAIQYISNFKDFFIENKVSEDLEHYWCEKLKRSW